MEVGNIVLHSIDAYRDDCDALGLGAKERIGIVSKI